MPHQKSATCSNERQCGGQWREVIWWPQGGFVYAPQYSFMRQTIVLYKNLYATRNKIVQSGSNINFSSKNWQTLVMRDNE